jgi:synaptotagmin-1
VKAVLVHDGKRVKKRKTSVKKACLNPMFNESMVFEIPTQEHDSLQESTHILVSVIDHDM